MEQVVKSSPSHLILAQRKALSTLLTIYESLGPLEFEFYANDKGKKLDHLLKEIEIIVDFRKEQTKNSEPLFEFAQSVISEFIKRTEDIVGDLPPHLSADLINLIKNKASNIICTDCESGPCNGSPFDDERVHTHGACIGSIHEMFQFAFNVAYQYYLNYSSFTKSKCPSIFLSTISYEKKPHNIPVDFNVTGKTVFQFDDTNEISEIQLHLWPEQYRFKCYLSTLYIFFHECICHAFQNLIHQHGTREAPESKDFYSEGWMDWISFSIMEKVLKGKGLKIEHHHNLPFSKSNIKLGKKFHEARIEYRNKPISKHAVRRALGAETAEKFYDFLVKENNLGVQHGWDVFLRISFDLNLFFYDYLQMQEFVNKLYSILPEPSPELIIPSKIEPFYKLKKIIDRYLTKKNINELFGDVLSLEMNVPSN
jgi:hypothetical protein